MSGPLVLLLRAGLRESRSPYAQGEFRLSALTIRVTPPRPTRSVLFPPRPLIGAPRAAAREAPHPLGAVPQSTSSITFHFPPTSCHRPSPTRGDPLADHLTPFWTQKWEINEMRSSSVRPLGSWVIPITAYRSRKEANWIQYIRRPLGNQRIE